MITYIGNNKPAYTMLFDKASSKIGLKPIVRQELGEDGEYHDVYYRSYQDVSVIPNEWKERPCVEGEVDENGNFYEYAYDTNGNIIRDNNGNPTFTTKILKGISSLNEYFHHMTEFASAAVEFGKRTGTDPYLLRLPLDEPFFEINANTRAITVPSSLSQVGIVGDKYAEILFFRIDRYFDAIDLATRNIYIEWQIGDKKGFSRDFLKDTQSEKDKIIFGWLIDDRLTQTPGSINFAVRFVEWDNNIEVNNENQVVEVDYSRTGGNILYSFSTLPATITVANSLNYSLFEDDADFDSYSTTISTDHINHLVYNLLTSSDLDTDGAASDKYAFPPEFVKNLATEANLQGPEQMNQSLELEVEAISSDGGVINYSYGYKELEESSFGSAGRTIIDFIKVTSLVDDGRPYYAFDEGNMLKMIDYTTAVEYLAENKEVRERVAHITVRRPGYYIARAHNQVSGKRVKTEYSNILHIPAASKPTVTTFVTDSELGYEPFVINKKVYVEDQIAAEDLTDSNYTDVTFVQDELQNGPATKQLAFTATGDNLSYQWYRGTAADMSDATPIEGATTTSYTVSNPGYYSAVATNTFNNSIANTDFDAIGICRVTNMPVPATISNWADFKRGILSNEIKALKVEKPAESDSVTFEWRKVTMRNAEDRDILTQDHFNALVSGTLEFDSNGIAEINFAPSETGKYFVIIYNNLNGATAITHGAEVYGVIEVEQAEA